MAGYVAAGLVLGLAGVLPLPAWANGGTARLSRAAAGPYRVSVWTQPSPPRVGALDVSVAVMRPSGEVITDVAARMSAEVIGRPGPTPAVTLTPGAGRDPHLYHGDLQIPVAGPWRVTVAVEGPAGTGQAAFDLDVAPPKTVDWRLLLVAIPLVGLAVWWAIFRSGAASAQASDEKGRESV